MTIYPRPEITKPKKGTILEISMLVNYPLSCLNRDRSGTPKSLNFGGVNRAAISSQCQKRAIREALAERCPSTGLRTRRAPAIIRDLLLDMGVKEDLAKVGMQMVAAKFGYNTEDEELTNQNIAFNDNELTVMAELIKEMFESEGLSASAARKKFLKTEKGKDGKEKKNPKLVPTSDFKTQFKPIKKKAEEAPNTLGLALSGRMDATKTFDNIEGSWSIGFAFGTNPFVITSDFFTALDDLDKENGAAMMGDTDYTSACFYVHVVLDVNQLEDNLAGYEDVQGFIKEFIPVFIETVVTTNPTAKKHSTDSAQRPSAVLVEVKDSVCSYANAFVSPIKSGNLIQTSVERLAEECDSSQAVWGIGCRKRVWLAPAVNDNEKVSLNCAKNVNTLKELLAEFDDIYAL